LPRKRDRLLEKIEEIEQAFLHAQQEGFSAVVRTIKQLVIEDREAEKNARKKKRRYKLR